MRHEVSFPNVRGVTLRGTLVVPDDLTGPVPGVVMTHGFSATRHMGLLPFAEAIAAAGVAVLVHDHACLGDSDGEPRPLVDPWAQAADVRHALGWLGERPEVDAGRLAVWGTSYSGAVALVVAALDTRVRAVVVAVPFAGLPNLDYDDAGAVRARFDAMRAVVDATAAGERTGTGAPVGPLRVVRDDTDGGGTGGADAPPVVLDQPEAAEWFLRVGGQPGSGWRNTVWMASGPAGVVWDPGAAAMQLAVPSLWAVATDDRLALTEVTLASFARTPDPKQLELVEGHHFTPYEGEANVRVRAVMAGFLARELGVAR